MYNVSEKDRIVCIILSGGLSSRMEVHKALLPFSDTQNFLQHIIEVYQRAGIKKVIVVKNKEIDLSGMEFNKDGLQIVSNHYPEKGRLHSIQLGICASHDADYFFIQNIDNPFVSTELIEQLVTHKSIAGYMSPDYKGKGGHPVLLSTAILYKIEGITDYGMTLREVLSEFPRFKFATDEEQCTRNINTKEDYERYFSCLKKYVAA